MTKWVPKPLNDAQTGDPILQRDEIRRYMMADRYLGDCYVCGASITHYSHKDATNDHYVALPFSSGEMELPEDQRPPRKVRCSGCHPGSATWMDSPVGKASPLRRYFEAGREMQVQARVKAAATKSTRLGTASPLLKTFAGRIRYFIHMENVSKDFIPWKLELVDNGKYFLAELNDEGKLTIEAHGTPVTFEPKKTLTERLYDAVQ